MNLDFAILAGALTAIYAGMKNIMDTVYVINAKRDIILDIDSDGERLDRARKHHLLYTDVKPMIIGLALFLAVYTSAFFLLAFMIHVGRIKNVSHFMAFFLDAAGIASLYALWIVITKNYHSFKIMRTYVRSMTGHEDFAPLPGYSDDKAEPVDGAPVANNPMHGSGEIGRI